MPTKKQDKPKRKDNGVSLVYEPPEGKPLRRYRWFKTRGLREFELDMLLDHYVGLGYRLTETRHGVVIMELNVWPQANDAPLDQGFYEKLWKSKGKNVIDMQSAL